ncbi:MAG: aminotransferase class I/II-fold pyridoxal phosphate-dependent enzyme [Treponema sp.]|nr:aminotransferase class I/II-fold pyridoxal phosphate-dependent enzyme [Treponema sp.]MCL2271857.1 aminotransferase class I/II-fold pyridoxal phosphate-dependent enzyme [Treponema sp.]
MYISRLASSSGINILQVLEERRVCLISQGADIINLSVGTPDRPPAAHIMQAVAEASKNPQNYRYTLIDPPALVNAVQNWYKTRYSAEIAPEEMLSVYGSQEGFAHIFHALCDPGDLVITGTPGYPIFFYGPKMAGAEVYRTPLLPENKFLIDFNSIPSDIAKRARVIVVCYPSNPLGAVAGMDFYKRLVDFAKRNDIIVIHDNAYSELVHDDPPAGSFLSIPGAKDIGIEFNSLSKSYNLTGLRISFVLGNRQIIGAFRKLRTNIDYGLSSLDHEAAIAALCGPQDVVEENRAAYRERRNAFCAALSKNGWNVPMTPASMFTWFPMPFSGMTSEQFCLDLLDKAGVICVPGSSFGEGGEGWLRFALTQPPQKLEEAARRIGEYLKKR